MRLTAVPGAGGRPAAGAGRAPRLSTSLLRIYSFTAGPAAFLAYQSALFRRFLEDEHELIVINDGQDASSCEAIEVAAEEAGLRCERVPLEPCGDPSIGLANAMELVLAGLARADDDLSLFVHADVFACRPFSARALLDGADLVAYPELKVSSDGVTAVHYPWSGLIGLRVPALPELDTIRFAPGEVDGVRCDTGGMFALYAARHPALRMRALDKRPAPSVLGGHDFELVSDVLFHYLRGSGWSADDRPSRAAKQAAAFDLFDGLLGGATRLPRLEAPPTTRPWPASRR